IRVTALFDKGAMISAMCSSFFEKIKHCLGNWTPSSKRLQMANGAIIPSHTTWRGEVEIKGIKAYGEFKVFDSGGRWKFLFGKPMLHAFKAIHNYQTDKVDIIGIGGTCTLHNLSLAKKASINKVVEEVHNLGASSEDQGEDRNKHPPVHQEKKNPKPKPNCLAGHNAARHVGGQRWRMSEESKTKQQVSTEDKNTDPITPTENEIPICILTEDGDMPKALIEAMLKEIPVGFLENDNAIFTRLTDPFNANRVAFIIKKV
ncbi:uncharacterized protein BJ212DRAFT_1260337, partial [Suillus subaureus]